VFLPPSAPFITYSVSRVPGSFLCPNFGTLALLPFFPYIKPEGGVNSLTAVLNGGGFSFSRLSSVNSPAVFFFLTRQPMSSFYRLRHALLQRLLLRSLSPPCIRIVSVTVFFPEPCLIFSSPPPPFVTKTLSPQKGALEGPIRKYFPTPGPFFVWFF